MSAWVESANTELKRWVSGELSFNNEGFQAKEGESLATESTTMIQVHERVKLDYLWKMSSV